MSRRIPAARLAVVVVLATAILGRAAPHSPPADRVERTGATPPTRLVFTVALERGRGREQALHPSSPDSPTPPCPTAGSSTRRRRRDGAPAARLVRVAARLRSHGMQVDPAQPQRTALVHATAGQLRTAFG